MAEHTSEQASGRPGEPGTTRETGQAPRPGPATVVEPVPISDAAERLGTTPRMLRYRESLGLLPRTKDLPSGRGHRHRRFSSGDLSAIEEGLQLEHDYDITPTALAFALRVLADPDASARVRAYGERVGRLSPPPTRALDFEKQKALRLLAGRSQPR